MDSVRPIDLRSPSLGAKEIEKIKNDIRELEEYRDEIKTHFGYKTMVQEKEREIYEKKKYLEEHRPPKISGREKNKLLRERIELENEIGSEMLTWDECMETGHRENALAEKQFQFNNKYGEKMHRLREICRRLDPDNPELLDLERLRKR